MANAIGIPWATYLTIVASLSVAERLAFALTGSELDAVNRLVDILLLATAGGGMIAVPALCCYRARGLKRPGAAFGWIFVSSIVMPVLAAFLVTLMVHNLDGGLLLFILPVTGPITTLVGALILLVTTRR